MKTKGRANSTDKFVSNRVKEARLSVRPFMTQESMALKLCVTFQQIQKYESGANRISAGRLADISRVTGKPVNWFFPDHCSAGDEGKLRRQVEKLSIVSERLTAKLNAICQIAGTV